jgi:hypothetical protein
MVTRLCGNNFATYFSKIHCNINLPSIPVSFNWFFPWVCLTKKYLPSYPLRVLQLKFVLVMKYLSMRQVYMNNKLLMGTKLWTNRQVLLPQCVTRWCCVSFAARRMVLPLALLLSPIIYFFPSRFLINLWRPLFLPCSAASILYFPVIITTLPS